MCNAIYYLTYTSKITLLGAINPFTFKTIEQISMQNNHAQHITGFLLFKNGHFFNIWKAIRHWSLTCTKIYLKIIAIKI